MSCSVSVTEMAKSWIRARDKPSKGEVTHPLSSSHTHPHKHPCAPIVVIWETDPLWMKNDFTVLWNVYVGLSRYFCLSVICTVVCTKIQLAPFISKLLRQSYWQSKDGRHLKSFPFHHPESHTCGTKRQVLSQNQFKESTRVFRNSSVDLRCRESWSWETFHFPCEM